MTGNVWEWCWDWYLEYSGDSQVDPKGPDSGSSRVQRGGSWTHYPGSARTPARSAGNPTIPDGFYGFRIVRPLVQE